MSKQIVRKIGLVILPLYLTFFSGQKIVNAATLETIASGLSNPRGLTFGPDDALYVVEAGTGGEGPIINGPALGVDLSFGTSGAVTRINNNTQERIITDLPSFGYIPINSPPPPPSGVTGPALGPQDIAFLGEDIYLTIGYGSDLSFSELMEVGNFAPEADSLASLSRFFLNQDGIWEGADIIANLSDFEQINNPDREDRISNPYRLEVEENDFLVIDAGANDLSRVDSQGNISLENVFNSRTEGEFEIQSVPSALAIGPDGAYYVGEFTGTPYIEGAARIYRIMPGSSPEVYADGFTQINGLDFDSEGNLYVLEYSVNSLSSSEDLLGRLTFLPSNGSESQTIIDAGEGLIAPGGLTVEDDGTIYISNFGATPGQGEVVRIDRSISVPEPSFIFSLLLFSSSIKVYKNRLREK